MTRRFILLGIGLAWWALGLGCESSTPNDGGGDPTVACEGITCSGHGTCVVKDGVGFCDCDDGYRVGGTGFGECVASTLLCADADCGDHGQCVISQGVPFCACGDGFHAAGEDLLTCEPDSADPCDTISCSGHGQCLASGTVPFCECDDGYVAGGPFHLECLERPDPCAGLDCSGHGLCVSESGVPFCDCDDGYHVTAADHLVCAPDVVDPCAGVTCSDAGTCVDTGGAPSCECDPGFVAVGLTCVPESGWPATPEEYVVQGASYVDTFVLPSMADTDVCCHDFGEISESGPGTVDNAVATFAEAIEGLSGQSANAAHEQALENGEMVLIWDHRGDLSGASLQAVSFSGAFAPGTDYTAAAAGLGQVVLGLESFVGSTGAPRSVFTGDLAGGVLTAGPSTIYLPPSALFAGMPGDVWLPLDEARLVATMSGIGSDPLAVGHVSAELSGYFAKTDVAATFNDLIDQQCSCLGLTGDFLDADLTPECVSEADMLCSGDDEQACRDFAGGFCAVFFAFLGNMADIDLDSDPSDFEAFSFGVRLTAVPTEVVGLYDPCAELNLCPGTVESGSCVGSILTVCRLDADGCLVETVTDCESLGSTCEVGGSDAWCDCTSDPMCDGVNPGEGWCDGDTVEICRYDEASGCTFVEQTICYAPLVCDPGISDCACPLVAACEGYTGQPDCDGNVWRDCVFDEYDCYIAIDEDCGANICDPDYGACVESGSCLQPIVVQNDHFLAEGISFYAEATDYGAFNDASCFTLGGISGPELAYQVTVPAGQQLFVVEEGGIAATVLLDYGTCHVDQGCAEAQDDLDGPVEQYDATERTLVVVVQAQGLGQAVEDYRIRIEIDPVCGNLITDGRDECDDGDGSGDGCDNCTLEFGYSCDTTVVPSTCAPWPIIQVDEGAPYSGAGQALGEGEEARYLLQIMRDGQLALDLVGVNGDVDLEIYESSGALVVDAINAGDEHLVDLAMVSGDYLLVVRGATVVDSFTLGVSLVGT